MKKLEHTIGYKGFDENFKCRGFQYEVGKTYTHNGEAKLCSEGFHFCENPLDVFNYYPIVGSKFALVDATYVSPETDNDSKRASKKLKITAELSLHGMIEAGVKFILERVDNTKSANERFSAATNTGDRSAATNTGYRSAATNTGDRSAATNTGDSSAATNTGDSSAATNTGDRSAATNTGYSSAASVEGKYSVAIATGIEGRASGRKNCWLTLAEWTYDDDKWEWELKEVKSVKVDGKIIKEDTFYSLVNGEFVEA